MKIKDRTRWILTVITVFILSTNRCVLADGDVEFWQTAITFIDIDKDRTVSVQEHLKVGDDADRLYYHHTDLGFIYKRLGHGITLGFNYKQVHKKEDDGRWSLENRPHLNILFKGQLGSIDFINRSRFEFRDQEDEEDLWRYTHWLKLTLPFEFTKFKFRPCIADQVYLNLEGQTFEKNRIYSGVRFELSENVESEIYYVWQSGKEDGHWEDLHALGLLFRLRF